MPPQTHTYESLWRDVLADIELELSPASFSTWVKGSYITREEDGTVFVALSSQFARDWVAEKYQKMILRILREKESSIRSVSFVVGKDKKDAPEKERPIFNHSADSLGLDDLYINKEDNLNPRYTFESFVVGSFNELAYAAALGTLQELGRRYNPLFVHGHTGHGKTHLIQAIGNKVKDGHPSKKVFYVTCEKFTQDLVTAIQSKGMASFKDRYRKYDVFIMDDIQFMANKQKAQEEMFHLFNTLYDNNKQIVFSSDQHPNYIPGLEERLKSRFSAGMTVDIPAPDTESRIAIIKNKLIKNSFTLTDEVVEYLATSVDGNIRELEGALNAIVCQAQLKNKELSVNEVREVIKNSIKPKKMIPIEDVVTIVSDFYTIPKDLIYKKTRKKEVVKPRQVIMYLLREDFSLPYPTIGSKLGKRDHTTVIHSFEKIKKELEVDTELAQEIHQIRLIMQ